MQEFNAYQFFLCVVVFSILTVIFTAMVIYVVKVTCKFIDLGERDEKIKTEYQKNQAKKTSLFYKILDKVSLGFFALLFVAVFSLGVTISVRENDVVGKIPTLKVVQSGSMSYVNEYNKYVDKDEVTEHINTFDLIVVHKLPKAEDLKINDIVLYEIDGLLLVHRIVEIELPNEEHPDEIHFLLHGDANEFPDKFPVKYQQMKGIYLGKRVPFVGSFVSFMQSPAGYLCIILIIFATLALPFAEKKINRKKRERLIKIGFIANETEFASENNLSQTNQNDIPENETAITLDTQEQRSVFERFGKSKSFEEKLSTFESARTPYDEITALLIRIEKIRVVRGFKNETYRSGNNAICKLAIRGKTLNAYLSLNPSEFDGSKYLFTDVSSVKAYANYPMRIKITSARQVRWTKELITHIVNKLNLTLASEQITKENLFSSFGKSRPFAYKLRKASETTKDRYKEISNHLKSFEKMRVVRGFKGETYRSSNNAICKLAIRGKTLNAYLSLNPSEFSGSKYLFTDVSSVKAYANYPMRIKITSARQVRWTKELIDLTVTKKGGSL